MSFLYFIEKNVPLVFKKEKSDLMFRFLTHLGRYLQLIWNAFQKPEKASIYRRQIMVELDYLGIDSLGIVSIISLFMGAVVAIQTAYNIDTPWIPRYTVGFTTRQSIILEFSPTIVCLILAGKVGSRISSEIGTMRVTEQIDALEIMGVNPSGYLILPKIVASLIIFPILVIISMTLGMLGGYLVAAISDSFTRETFLFGLKAWFNPYEVIYSLVKTDVFAFIIVTVSAYQGFFVKGGAIGVSRATTRAVVYSSILIILFNLLITQIMLD